MDVVPKEAPVYGGGQIQLKVGVVPEGDDVNYYLVFLGSQLRHVIPATPSWKDEALHLTAIIPSHAKPETVELIAYVSHQGEVKPLDASISFQYASDSAHQMAIFLLGSVDHPSTLDDLELICKERFQLTPDVQANLDERLTAAFKTLYLPPCWNMMGTKQKGADPAERLLHFSARLGLKQLSSHLLTLPGSHVALSALNHEELLPEELAQNAGFHDLANLFQQKQEAVSQWSRPALVSSEISSSPLVTTNLSWSNRDLEYDISELERIKSEFADKERKELRSLEDMKELHLKKNGGREPEVLNKEVTEMPGCLDRLSPSSRPSSGLRSHSPRHQARVLEDNLRRLRDIHEGIQRLRELNTKQIVVHQSQKSGTPRLSSSCPALFLTSVLTGEDGHSQRESIFSMRSIDRRRTSLSANSCSLDSAFIESINVKIHVNDITPSVSQEHLNSAPPANVAESYQSSKILSNGPTHSKKIANIGGTASERLAKRSSKKVPVRRQSWSSLGAAVSQESEEEKHHIQRRWSLSSLDSDGEETFCEQSVSSGFMTKDFISRQSSSPVEMPEISKEKLRTLSTGSCEESYLSKSGKQSSSVPSMCDITAEIKENVEPEKTHSTGSLSTTAKSFLVSFRNHPLQKSVSTPSIVGDDDLPERGKQDAVNRQSLCTMHPLPLPLHDINDTPQAHVDVEGNVSALHHVSLAGLLREGQLHSIAVDSDEEKPFTKRKKRSSIFFKKKPDKHKAKEGKKSAHQFSSVHGTLVSCDVCLKPFVKKQALKCENCLVTVHDSSCKDQVLDCNKFRIQKAQNKPTNVPVSKEQVQQQSSNASSTTNQNKNATQQQHLVKERQNLLPSQGLNSQTGIPSLCETGSRSSVTGFSCQRSNTPSVNSQWQRVATKLGVNKMISEEKDLDGGYDMASNIAETNSASMESLDEGAHEISDLEDNQVLRLIDDEPETWNATVDKKVVKKLKEREVKRQEVIYELIITEKHHCLTLQIMQKVYAQGMIKELSMSHDLVERILPCLGELLDLHRTFLCKLRERQSQSPVVDQISDILHEQFHDRAEQMKNAYGHFCSQHIEALNLFKDMSKTDRKFQNFIKKCSTKRLCKTRGIPECLLLVTQRITKYILLIEMLIKAAKDNKEEQETLIRILGNLKGIISQVDVQVAEKGKEMRLLEIYNKMDPKSTIFYRGKKFKKSDFLSNNRKLRRNGPLTWKSPRGKTIDVLAVVLSDYIFFLQENNQKYFFASLENKPGMISLQKLLVRKKAGQDSRGMYLISSNPNEPEMFELFFQTPKDQKMWMETIREAVECCPDEDEGVPSETEEERKLEAARVSRVRELMGLLHEKDMGLALLCEERMRVMVDMLGRYFSCGIWYLLLEVVGIESEQYENVKYAHLIESDNGPETKELISFAVKSASRLANSLYASGSNLSRSVSSAGEHQSETYVSPLLPKRAETFGGFDNPSKEQIILNKVPVLKKKLLHLKESESLNFLHLKDKDDLEVELRQSLESALRSIDSKTVKPPSRPASGCNSPDKHQNRKSLVISHSLPQIISFQDKEIGTELARLNATPLLMTHGKEQLVQIVELAHHLNTLVCTVSHLSSAFESLKTQMVEANDKITKLAKEKEGRDRRPLYRPEHQLEELRNLQKQLNHDRAVWQQEKSQHEEEIKNQRAELERLQEQLKTEQVDVTTQRELLYRKLDALQKQGIILSPSHTVVNLNNCITREADHKEENRVANSTADIPIGALEHMQHRRTVSFDIQHDHVEHSSLPSGSLTAPVIHRQDSKNRPTHNLSNVPISGKIIPLHLCSSATNLHKRQSITTQPVKQQLPLKLANSNAANGMLGQVNQTPHQVLPLKLAVGSLPSSIPSLVTNIGTKNVPKRSHSAASSPSSTLTTPVHVRGGSSPALVQTTFPTSVNSSTSQGTKPENSILHQLKLTSDKMKKNKDRDSNEEIFC